ncbi:MAG: V-type ATPase 116kDa subunit family protein [Candidatus Izemoplasmatales bacterium]|jgi:V/A-type H+-transporting ATPase subunit I|nr:V-type ATPase 116kDa subunit family protein [Candidatus Izemoplasmatales bacterium]MDD4595946.1 V-type ATPase 116kDa subunit family protein [Candidatus Izemoplasmatales bacterium]
MSIAKTKLITISSSLDKLDQTLMRFIDLEDFHPVFSSKIVETVHGLTSFSPDNACTGIISELAQLEREFNLDLPNLEVRSTDYDFEKFHQTITESHNLLKEYLEKIKEDQALIAKYQEALTQVKNIESLDVSLDDIFSCRYVYARAGRLPIDSVEKLKYYRNRPFVFKSFSNDQSFSWCMYFTTPEYEREIDNIFSSLFFERIRIPDFVHGTPEKAEETLQTEINRLNGDIETKNQELQAMTDDYSRRLSTLKGQLLFLNRIFEAKRYVVGLGDRFTISGFTEVANVDKVKNQFAGIDDLEIEVRPPGSDKRIMPPTKLKNGWFSRPFSIFVEMYGVPAYGGIDPTPFFAITYCLLFGVMFGDLGQGLLLALFGLILAKWKKSKLGEIAIRIGLFSAFFGLLYGSFFGNEEILTPFYTDVLHMASKPIEIMDSGSTMTLLIGALSIGALLIILAIGMGIYTNLRKRKYIEAFFSHNGFAGLIFYVYVLVALALSMLGLGNILTWPFLIPFIGVPLILIFMKEPIARKHEGKKMFPSGIGGFVMEGFFELFDVVLSYVTNTMSFMRVGGFILSHAGMMLVVTSLMEMVGNSGWLVGIFGNLFVMLLEGLIVGIQVLRLEYYEMFSRYYDGNGIAFQTIKQ